MIELLVVIAIAAVLASLLLPALARANALAKRVYCQNNLRQLGAALNMYSDDHGRFPPLTRYIVVQTGLNPEGSTISLWNAALLPYVGQNRETFYCRAFPASFRWTTEPSRNWFGYPTNIQGNRAFCYAINQFGVAGAGSLGLESSVVGTGRTPGEIRAPADMIAIGDDTDQVSRGLWERGKFGGWGRFVVWRTFGTTNAILGRVHSRGANMVFLDGHSEWRRQWQWLAPTEEATRRWNYDNEPHAEFWR